LERDLRQKIDLLEQKIGESEQELPVDLEWSRRVTSNEMWRHYYGKYELFLNETKKNMKGKCEKIEELSLGL
jgi:hypothetical protein